MKRKIQNFRMKCKMDIFKRLRKLPKFHREFIYNKTIKGIFVYLLINYIFNINYNI